MELKYFKAHEFTDIKKMDESFLLFIDRLRDRVGFPLRLNSTYRDPSHNGDVGGVSKSAHTEIPCKAADIRIEDGRERYLIVTAALDLGCRRIGIGQTFVHLDFSDQKSQEVLWHYYK